ncbi:hypothetical protein FAM6161_02277 [Lacticaseibacillus paracasei]|nr:hypothetical protein FAM6161_02277 [Lacticaseibacillus paracasei]
MPTNKGITVAREEDPDLKQAIVQAVLADLPEWFGLPDATNAYVEEAAKLSLWVACYEGQDGLLAMRVRRLGLSIIAKPARQAAKSVVWALRNTFIIKGLAISW